MRKETGRLYSMTEVSKYASILLDPEPSLKPADIANIVNRHGQEGSPIEPQWTGSRKRVRKFTRRQLPYFAIINMATLLGASYDTAMRIVAGVSDRDLVKELLEENRGVAAVLVNRVTVSEGAIRIITFKTPKEFLSELGKTIQMFSGKNPRVTVSEGIYPEISPKPIQVWARWSQLYNFSVRVIPISYAVVLTGARELPEMG